MTRGQVGRIEPARKAGEGGDIEGDLRGRTYGIAPVGGSKVEAKTQGRSHRYRTIGEGEFGPVVGDPCDEGVEIVGNGPNQVILDKVGEIGGKPGEVLHGSAHEGEEVAQVGAVVRKS